MRIPISIVFSDDSVITQALRKKLLTAAPVSGVTEKTHWNDMKPEQRDALYKAYYNTKEQTEVKVTDLSAIAIAKPAKPDSFNDVSP